MPATNESSARIKELDFGRVSSLDIDKDQTKGGRSGGGRGAGNEEVDVGNATVYSGKQFLRAECLKIRWKSK